MCTFFGVILFDHCSFFSSTGDSEWTLKKLDGARAAGNQKRRRGICAF